MNAATAQHQVPEGSTSAHATSSSEPSACTGRLLVTELMVNPKATRDELGEYVELFNPGNDPVDLRGWKLSNGSRQAVTFEGDTPLWIGARQVALLLQSLDPDENGDLQGLTELGRLSLPNDGGLLKLTDPCGVDHVRFRYSGKKPWNAARAGVAIELVDVSADARDHRSWKQVRKAYATGDKGTPGVWAPGAGTKRRN